LSPASLSNGEAGDKPLRHRLDLGRYAAQTPSS
jgi:hypothetical protein